MRLRFTKSLVGATALLAIGGYVFLSPGSGSLGVIVAQAVIAVRGWMVGFGSALEAVWATAALPLSVGGGIRGVNLHLAPVDLVAAFGATVVDLSTAD